MATAEARYLKMNYDQVIRKLRHYANSKARARSDIKAIVLTGSLAKGSYTGSSDADILVIADNLPTRILERYVIFSEADFPVELEPHAYTAEEFTNMVHQGNHFAVETLRVGVPLYGKKYFNRLREQLKAVEHPEESRT